MTVDELRRELEGAPGHIDVVVLTIEYTINHRAESVESPCYIEAIGADVRNAPHRGLNAGHGCQALVIDARGDKT